MQCLASAMPNVAMPSRVKLRKVFKETKRKNLAVLAKTQRLNRFFFSAKPSSSNVEAVASTRAPENVGGNHDIGFEAPFTVSLAGHVEMLLFRCFSLYLWFLLIVRVNVVSCRVTL